MKEADAEPEGEEGRGRKILTVRAAINHSNTSSAFVARDGCEFSNRVKYNKNKQVEEEEAKQKEGDAKEVEEEGNEEGSRFGNRVEDKFKDKFRNNS